MTARRVLPRAALQVPLPQLRKGGVRLAHAVPMQIGVTARVRMKRCVYACMNREKERERENGKAMNTLSVVR